VTDFGQDNEFRVHNGVLESFHDGCGRRLVLVATDDESRNANSVVRRVFCASKSDARSSVGFGVGGKKELSDKRSAFKSFLLISGGVFP
jgi:hypothetical protein